MNPMFMNQMSPNPPMKSSRSNRKVSPDKKSEENDDQSTSNENPLSPNTDKMNQGVPMGNGSPMQRNQTQTGQENLKMDGANQNLRGGINPGQSMGGYNQAQTGSNESFVPNMNTGGFSMNGMGNPHMDGMGGFQQGMGSPQVDSNKEWEVLIWMVWVDSNKEWVWCGMGGFPQGMGSPHMGGMGGFPQGMGGMGGFQQGMGSPHMGGMGGFPQGMGSPHMGGMGGFNLKELENQVTTLEKKFKKRSPKQKKN
eukprot:TRINITY_DN1298_c0_g2_i8.p1 TRINITY_DN1298_c0_g2~~TRINITY_DN1298_c0_g2_i8.p1  ORF type:complete len:290 (-),score=68.20 TRINITY_DN1298_c0_g2_i8:21-779(-)